jgi:hypothetical protein
MEEGFFLKENKDSIIKIEKTIPNKFGCIELGFVEKKEKIINTVINNKIKKDCFTK